MIANVSSSPMLVGTSLGGIMSARATLVGSNEVNPHEKFTKKWFEFEMLSSNERARVAIDDWLRDFSDEPIDLSFTNLRNANLSGVDLEGANLSDANLRDAKLGGANLDDVIFTGANLEGADFENASLCSACFSGTIFRRTSLVRTSFAHAKLCNADLSRQRLESAYFPGADLEGADVGMADFGEAKTLTPIQLFSVKNLERALLPRDLQAATEALRARKLAEANAAKLAEQHSMLEAIMDAVGASLKDG